MKLMPVKSSNLHAVGYDPVSQVLRVQFKGSGDQVGKVFEYAGVPPKKFAEMQAAKSVGSFFSTKVRMEHKSKEIK